MIKAILIITNIFLIFVLAALLFFLTKTYLDMENEKKAIFKVIASRNLPPFADEQYDWKQAISNDPQSISQAKLDTYLIASGGASISKLPLLGKEWIYSKTYKTKEELKGAPDLTSYFLDKLQSDGWRLNMNIENVSISGVAAQTTYGNVFSQLKEGINTVEIFVMSSFTDTFTCPCTTTTRLFKSNPYDISQIISSK